jgi:hypothetical protein
LSWLSIFGRKGDGFRFRSTHPTDYPETKAAFLQLDGKSLQLPKRFSLTSQRFSKDGTVFRMKKGGQATIKRAGRTSVDCQVK